MLLICPISALFHRIIIKVVAPILKNERNLKKFPQCIADDIKRQVHELSTSVYQIRGHIKGKTLLPFPQVTGPLREFCFEYTLLFFTFSIECEQINLAILFFLLPKQWEMVAGRRIGALGKNIAVE